MTERPISPVRVLMTTAPTAQDAERIGTMLVAERLAACANVVPGITSIYRWEGEIKREPEVLVILKTTTAAAEPLKARIVELHPYDVPEVVEVPVEGGHEPYLAWVRGEVAPT